MQVNTNTLICCTVTESNLSYGWKTWTMDYEFKKKLLITETDFGRKDAKTSKLLK
jgi:hypothetical protein